MKADAVKITDGVYWVGAHPSPSRDSDMLVNVTSPAV